MLILLNYRNVRPLKNQPKQQNRTSVRRSVTTGKRPDAKIAKKDDRKAPRKDDVNKVNFIFIL